MNWTLESSGTIICNDDEEFYNFNVQSDERTWHRVFLTFYVQSELLTSQQSWPAHPPSYPEPLQWICQPQTSQELTLKTES